MDERHTDDGDGDQTEPTTGPRDRPPGDGPTRLLPDGGEDAAARSELERQDERLEQFASVLSHDLRNPLNVAMGRLQLIEEDCDSDHIEPVDRALERMETLISDVLTLAREGSRLTDPEPVDVGEAVTQAWSTTSTPDAELTAEDDLGVVQSSESRLSAIFENCFQNAVQHGGPSVQITVGRLEDGFYVADDGPGIPDDETEDVFEYGYTTTEEGTGFGLTIVRDVALAHGWSVNLTESEDGGARFEFRDVEFE